MKKKLLLFFLGMLIILFAQNTSSLIINSMNEDVEIDYFNQKCIAYEWGDLYCNTLVEFIIGNLTSSNIEFRISDRNIGIPEFYNESVCLSKKFPNDLKKNPYMEFNLTCMGELEFKKELDKNGDLRVQIDSDKLDQKRYYLFFNHTVKNFVTIDPLYNILFFNLGNLNSNASVYRIVTLPKDSIIDVGSLHNFKIMASFSDGRRILSTDSKNAIVVYRSWDKEQKERNLRDKLVIFISFAFAIIFGFLFSDKKLSKRTKNCFMLFGFSLLITSWILLEGVKGKILLKILLIISFIFIPFFGSLAFYSRAKDHKRMSWKGDLIEIKKIILEIIGKLFRKK